MSYPEEPDQRWHDGALTEDDLIESADGTGYTSVSDYAPASVDDSYDDHH